MSNHILVDSSFMYALYNKEEVHHAEALEFIQTNRQKRILPDVILPEVTFLFQRFGGERAVIVFLENLDDSKPRLEPLIQADITRVRQVKQRYFGSRLDFVDCAILSMAECLSITQVLTFDRRDFSMFRPKHCDYLELLP